MIIMAGLFRRFFDKKKPLPKNIPQIYHLIRTLSTHLVLKSGKPI
jgi:hypothetical protein